MQLRLGMRRSCQCSPSVQDGCGIPNPLEMSEEGKRNHRRLE